jgi:hypothetical protein
MVASLASESGAIALPWLSSFKLAVASLGIPAGRSAIALPHL